MLVSVCPQSTMMTTTQRQLNVGPALPAMASIHRAVHLAERA